MEIHAADNNKIDRHFDAIVVGARIAGCTLAYQLARRGWRVALVEKHPLPLGPTLSVPLTYARGLAMFRALDLSPVLDHVTEQLTPIRRISLRLDDTLTLAGDLPPWAGFDHAYILPRERLDEALLSFVMEQQHAMPGNITLFAGRRVERLLRRDEMTAAPAKGDGHNPVVGVGIVVGAGDGHANTLFAPLVIGADGRLSRVATLLGDEATRYGVVQPTTSFCYSYCRGIDRSGLPDGFMARAKDMRVVVVTQIDDDLQMIGVYMPAEQYQAFRTEGQSRTLHHAQSELRATWESVPELAGRMEHFEFVGKVLGLDPRWGAGYFRPAGGPGWALVGDAAHFKDPSSAQGIHDALYTVRELLSSLNAATGGRPLTWNEAGGTHWPKAVQQRQQRRDAQLGPMYAFTNSLSYLLTHTPSRREYAMLRCLADDPDLMRRFLGIFMGGTEFGTFKRELARHLVWRLASHGLDLPGLLHDARYLFHRPVPDELPEPALDASQRPMSSESSDISA